MPERHAKVQEPKRHLFAVRGCGCVTAWISPDSTPDELEQFRRRMMVSGRTIVVVPEEHFEEYRERLDRCPHDDGRIEAFVPLTDAEALADALARAERNLAVGIHMEAERAGHGARTIGDALALIRDALAAYRALHPKPDALSRSVARMREQTARVEDHNRRIHGQPGCEKCGGTGRIPVQGWAWRDGDATSYPCSCQAAGQDREEDTR